MTGLPTVAIGSSTQIAQQGVGASTHGACGSGVTDLIEFHQPVGEDGPRRVEAGRGFQLEFRNGAVVMAIETLPACRPIGWSLQTDQRSVDDRRCSRKPDR